MSVNPENLVNLSPSSLEPGSFDLGSPDAGASHEIESSGFPTASCSSLNILAAALNSVSDSLVWTDAQHQILGCNAAFERLIGRSCSQVLGQGLPQVLPLQQQVCSGETTYPTQRLLQGDCSLGEYLYEHADQRLLLEISGDRTLGPDRQPVVVLAIRDVTPARAAAQSSAETLALLQSTLESTADGIFVVARSGRVLSYNQKFARMWNMPDFMLEQEAAASQRFQYLADQTADPAGFKARVLQLFDDTPEEAVFDRLVMKDGRIFERYSQPQRLDGKIIGRIWSYRDITEQQQAEQALRQSEEKYRAIFENSQVGMGRTQQGTGLIVEANQRFADIMGYRSPDELVGKICTRDLYINPQDREAILAELHRHGGVYDFEVQLRRQDGSPMWGLLSLRQNAAADCLEFVIADISERVRVEAERKRVEEDRQWAEAALRQREAEYRLLVETANSVILKWDTQGTVLFLNDYGQNFFGYAADEIIGRNIVGTIVPETETTGRDLEALMSDLCQHPDRYMFNENENLCKDGRRAWISWANKPIQNDQGQVVGILSIGADVTERRRLEETLRQSQQFLHMIVENVPITIFTKNIKTGFRYELINQNCERILGFTRQEGIGRTDYDLLPSHLADHFRAQDLAVIATGA
ncbi:MAG TPA: PAS domain S-box protein, partial [Trichocoleus sp.]